MYFYNFYLTLFCLLLVAIQLISKDKELNLITEKGKKGETKKTCIRSGRIRQKTVRSKLRNSQEAKFLRSRSKSKQAIVDRHCTLFNYSSVKDIPSLRDTGTSSLNARHLLFLQHISLPLDQHENGAKHARDRYP